MNKVKFNHEIRCEAKNRRNIKCPRGKGKWRGVVKCYGCPWAFVGRFPYAPSKPKNKDWMKTP